MEVALGMGHYRCDFTDVRLQMGHYRFGIRHLVKDVMMGVIHSHKFIIIIYSQNLSFFF